MAARAPGAPGARASCASCASPPGAHKPHALLVAAGLAKSNGEAVRLLRQRAVRRDGVVLEAARSSPLAPGESFVLSVGAARHVRIEAADEAEPITGVRSEAARWASNLRNSNKGG